MRDPGTDTCPASPEHADYRPENGPTFSPWCWPLLLKARYTDPRTKLRYHSLAEYNIIMSLTPALVSDYLAIRGATVVGV